MEEIFLSPDTGADDVITNWLCACDHGCDIICFCDVSCNYIGCDGGCLGVCS